MHMCIIGLVLALLLVMFFFRRREMFEDPTTPMMKIDDPSDVKQPISDDVKPPIYEPPISDNRTYNPRVDPVPEASKTRKTPLSMGKVPMTKKTVAMAKKPMARPVAPTAKRVPTMSVIKQPGVYKCDLQDGQGFVCTLVST